MITTLFFDLDDTLLGNDMGAFIPAYFGRLTRHFPEIDAQRFSTALMRGTRSMIANRDPRRTLERVFADHFYPALELTEAEWAPRFDSFYQTEFSHLQSVTQFRPAARQIMEWASAAGLELVVATSPLFPRAAILERLRWAGLSEIPFARITSYETSHFAKPHPEYLAELLAQLNRQPEQVLMVGNDWEQDMIPAATLGMAAYWIASPESSAPTPASGPIAGVGTLEMFAAWAPARVPTLSNGPRPATALPCLLTGSLAAARGELAAVPPEQWSARPGPAEWSLTELVCHLRDVDRDVNLPRIRAVLDAENPFISSADTDPWAITRHYQAQNGPAALQEWIDTRMELVQQLTTADPAIWKRPARHALFGPTHLAEIVGWMVDHDAIHLNQLRSVRQSLA